MLLPQVAKSRIESDDPRRVIPYALIDDPMRMNDLKLQVEPKLRKSKAEIEDPSLENP
jgi:hypothetical protein